MKTIIVLDAMGVIYQSCDDVKELLIPFILKNADNANAEMIKALYHKASLGTISADDFWKGFGLNSHIEAEYLLLHKLSAGIDEFLEANSQKYDIVCLSNDVSRWSKLLREQYNLTRYIKHWFISADLGFRKPNSEMFEAVENIIGKNNYLFFDDNQNNVESAQRFGWNAYCYIQNKVDEMDKSNCQKIRSFKEIEEILNNA